MKRLKVSEICGSTPEYCESDREERGKKMTVLREYDTQMQLLQEIHNRKLRIVEQAMRQQNKFKGKNSKEDREDHQ